MPRAGLNPEMITEAAAGIVDADGLSSLTLARLALHLGVAPPSLYKHVDSLDDLIFRVTLLSIRRFINALTAAALGRSGRQALVAVAEAYRNFAVEHRGLYSLTQKALKPEQHAEALRGFQVLVPVVKSYGVPDDLVIHGARVLRAGLHGFTDIEVSGSFQMAYSIDQSFMVLIDALDASLTKLGKQSEAATR